MPKLFGAPFVCDDIDLLKWIDELNRYVAGAPSAAAPADLDRSLPLRRAAVTAMRNLAMRNLQVGLIVLSDGKVRAYPPDHVEAVPSPWVPVTREPDALERYLVNGTE